MKIKRQECVTGEEHILVKIGVSALVPMLKISKYDEVNDSINMKCHCGGDSFSASLSHIGELKFISECNEYENIPITCPHCSSIHFLNVNIPADDYSEVELEETIMPLEDINNRKVLRDTMWKKRSDLKSKDRKLYNEEHKRYLHEWNIKKLKEK